MLNTYVHKEKITLFALINTFILGRSVQFSSVAQLCLILCNPMDCSMPGFPVHHQLLELAQTHVHQGTEYREPIKCREKRRF